MSNFPALKQQLSTPAIRNNIKQRIGSNTGTFITSLLDLCGEDDNLAACNPDLIIKEALKAAALQLPINKNLGFAYVLAYKQKRIPTPSFQMGYKGYLQLAIRTGQYKHLNAGVVYEGEEMVVDRIKGILSIGGEKASDKATGYFCYMQLTNGFEKAIGWTTEKVTAHAKKFSKSFNYSSSPWKTDFEAMALKTMILQLIPKYGPMTIEISEAMTHDRPINADPEGLVNEIDQNANTEVIDIPANINSKQMNEPEQRDIQSQKRPQTQPQQKTPPF